jgi:phosphoribosylglycinamide formyltransferase 1
VARLKVAALISGRGSNLQALIDACADPAFPAEIRLVISNNPDAQGLARAERAGIPNRVIPHKRFRDRPSFDAAVERALEEAGVELICLAGFMRIFSDGFVERWRNRMINIHPSLLPSFKGLKVHEQALAAGVRFTGCTVHFVRPAMDEGPIIVQAAVAVMPGDDAARLAERVLAEEHKIYPLALRLIAEGRVKVTGEHAEITGAIGPTPLALLNPAR